MRQKIEKLLELQKAEIEIGRLTAVLDGVPEKIAAMDEKQKSLQEAYDLEKEAMSVLKKKYRDMEADVQTNSDRISKSQQKLTAVKTNKEYQALLKEIDEHKEKRSAIEDDMIVCLEQMETAETDIAEKGENLKLLLNQIEADKNTLQLEAEEDRKRLEAACKSREELEGEVDAALKKDYEQVKKIVKDRIVVPVLKAVCQGCHMNIPPQMFIELQRVNQLKFCPHCGRILYWDDMLE